LFDLPEVDLLAVRFFLRLFAGKTNLDQWDHTMVVVVADDAILHT